MIQVVICDDQYNARRDTQQLVRDTAQKMRMTDRVGVETYAHGDQVVDLILSPHHKKHNG